MINRSDDELKSMLKYYVPSKWHDLNNWSTLINRQSKIAIGINLIKCSFMDLYFDDGGYPISYGKLHIINNKVYYDFNSDNNYAGTYSFIGDMYEYK